MLTDKKLMCVLYEWIKSKGAILNEQGLRMIKQIHSLQVIIPSLGISYILHVVTTITTVLHFELNSQIKKTHLAICYYDVLSIN